MGIYLNPTNDKFFKAVNSEIYVDKTDLIRYTNKVLNTIQQNICVSRPRRFGKSMAADMLTAYYSRGCNSAALFENLNIRKDASFSKYLNQYDTIFINVQDFLSRSSSIDEVIQNIKYQVICEWTDSCRKPAGCWWMPGIRSSLRVQWSSCCVFQAPAIRKKIVGRLCSAFPWRKFPHS